jgi:hypothetical protein
MKKTTINIQNEANIKAEGKLSGGNCKPVVCLDTGDVYTSCIDAAAAAGVHFTAMSSHLRGKTRTVHGKRYIYLSRVSEGLDAIVTRLRETAAVEADAKKWQAYQAEQEEKRKAEEKRQAEIAKADAKVERCQTIRDRIAAQLAEADRNLIAAQMEREALDDEEEEAA